MSSPAAALRAKPRPAVKAAPDLTAAFAAANARLDIPQVKWPGAVAVSGGSDSLALMHLLCDWANARHLAAPIVLCVDHGLRENSAEDARRVVGWAKALGLAAHVLRWKGAKPKADVEAAARAARYRLMGDWCVKHKITALYVGHTQDDQAETFLLRLARGSGLDGLSAMRDVAPLPLPGYEDVSVVRPLLAFSRDELKEFLSEGGHAWLDDPMNDDPGFARVRMRQASQTLDDLGLSAARLAQAASHLGRAREALDAARDALLTEATRFEDGRVLLNAAVLVAAPHEISLRALAEILGHLSGAPYRPRFERLERLFVAICAGKLGGGRTLQGCRIAPAPKRFAVFGPATLQITPEAGTKVHQTPSKNGKLPGRNVK